MDKFYRDTWVEIDIDALTHNYQAFQDLHPQQKMMAVIKANAYGHGDVKIAELFTQLGATYLAVSSLDEGLKLRHHGIATPIIVLAPVKIQDVSVAANNHITLIAYDEEWVEALMKKPPMQPLKLHLEVETGMNRIGIKKVAEMYEILARTPQVNVEGIYTHIASADSDLKSVEKQLEKFHQLKNQCLPNAFKYVHIANTATTLQFDLVGINMQRVGLGMYGINPDQHFIHSPLTLKPAFSFYSKLTQISHIKKGEGVSYGATFVAEEDIIVGTLSVGYADGWCRKNQGRKVMANNQACEIIGRICMDQMMIKLPSTDFQVGDDVMLIGEAMPVDQVASELQTIPYEILTLIGDRVPRVYHRNGKEVGYNLGRNERGSVDATGTKR